MRTLFLRLMLAALVCTSGCADYSDQDTAALALESATVEITSGDLTYPAYLAAPTEEGKYPAVVLIHSFNGLENGYREMTDKFASEGYVVIAPEWQTFEQAPRDEVVQGLIGASVDYLRTREDVDSQLLGLTGFCAGGRYTMLFLPQMTDFKSGVAWYGFPYSPGFNNQSMPAEFIEDLEIPMLMIHGSRDQPSPISDIYRYATDLDAAGKYFELKVYQGKGHGFMIEDGELAQDFVAQDAYREMVTFFDRTLK